MTKLFILSIFVLIGLSASSQARKNFEYNGKLYELHVDKSSTKAVLSICTPANKCNKSDSLLWPIDNDLFKSKFKSLLSLFDSTRTPKSGLNNDGVADSMYVWTKEQFKPKEETAGSRSIEEFKKALSAEDVNKQIGVLVMNTNEIKGKSVKEIYADIKDGVIGKRSLYVVMEDGSVYFNKNKSFSFPKYFRADSQALYLWKGEGNHCVKSNIMLGDVLDYTPFGKLYYPEDKEIYLIKSENKTRDTLKLSTSLNNMLEINVFSDLLGVFGSKANGLIQTEISGFFLSNSASIKGVDLTFHNFMRPYLRLSRYDNDFKSIDSTKISVKPQGDSIDRTYLAQVSYLQGGLKMNVARFNVGINQSFFLNVGAEVNLSNADSIYKKDIIFFNYYTELMYAITRLRNFGMDAGIRYFWQDLSSDGVNGHKIVNSDIVTFFSPTLSIFYHPLNNPNNRMYFRYTYISNLENKSSNYAQFQFGYRTALNLK